MIKFVAGNLLQSRAYALVNPVNCKGVMGKGLAYQFKKEYPEMFTEYAKKCRTKELSIGHLHCYDTGSKLIINFPTKDDWRDNSKMSYIDTGMDALVELLNTSSVASVAIPPLGCGCGGLDWGKVKELILQKLDNVRDSVDIYIYEPKL